MKYPQCCSLAAQRPTWGCQSSFLIILYVYTIDIHRTDSLAITLCVPQKTKKARRQEKSTIFHALYPPATDKSYLPATPTILHLHPSLKPNTYPLSINDHSINQQFYWVQGAVFCDNRFPHELFERGCGGAAFPSQTITLRRPMSLSQ